MYYYNYLFSPETYESFTRSDRTLAGVRKNQERAARRLQIGDRLICYVTKVGRWAGVFEVTAPAFEDSTPRFVPSDDPFVIRLQVETRVWLPIEKCVPIKERSVWDTLSFTKVINTTSGLGWTGVVRRSLNRLNDEDGRYLEHLLISQSNDGRDYPQDSDEWRRLIAKPVYRADKTVVVTVPSDTPNDLEPGQSSVPIRESHSVQARLAAVGEAMGFMVLIPKNDRPAVLKEWTPSPGILLDFPAELR